MDKMDKALWYYILGMLVDLANRFSDAGRIIIGKCLRRSLKILNLPLFAIMWNKWKY